MSIFITIAKLSWHRRRPLSSCDSFGTPVWAAGHHGRQWGPGGSLRGLEMAYEGVSEGCPAGVGLWMEGTAEFHGRTVKAESYSNSQQRNFALLYWSFNLHFFNNIGHLFLCLLAIHTHVLAKCLLKTFAPLKIYSLLSYCYEFFIF